MTKERIGLFGGGFKPFTTGHFAKLANAIRENDKVYLFYGLQVPKEKEYYVTTRKDRWAKGDVKPDKRLRSIGSTGKFYTPEISEEIFNIYEEAIENKLGNIVEVESTLGSTPMRRIFDVIQEFTEDPEKYEKVTIYGDESTIKDYLQPYNRRYFKNRDGTLDLLDAGKVQLGAIAPESSKDYLDPERLSALMSASEESARDALGSYYPGASAEDISRMQAVRGTEVRSSASVRETASEAEKFLPPFLDDQQKKAVINLILGEDSPQQQSETFLRAFVRGVIKG